MKITRWDTEEVIFELECDSWLELIKGAIKAKISFYRANLRYANLRYANLRYANLRHAYLGDADLRYANLGNANLGNAYLGNAYLGDADLRHAYLGNAYLGDADLRHVDLRHADLRDADLRDADLRDADLRYADLRYANLRDADLRHADLRDAVGNKREIKSMQIERYNTSFTKTHLTIGCQSHRIEDWRNFTDKEISGMDTGALDWWIKWRDFIFKAIELSFGDEK